MDPPGFAGEIDAGSHEARGGTPVERDERVGAHLHAAVATARLADANPGRVTIARISEKLELDDDGLNFVARARLIPGASATIVRRSNSGVLVRTPAGEHMVPPLVAEQMIVAIDAA